MFIGRSGFLGISTPSLGWGFDLGWRNMLGWRDSYTQNVNRAGWMLGDWGNAMIDTDPWRMFQQSGRRFVDDISTWLGLPAPNFANPFSLSTYDPMKQSTQTYVGGGSGGGSPGYSAPAGETRAGPPPVDGPVEKPLTEAERIEQAIKTEEAVRKKLEDEKKAEGKAAADKAAAEAKAAKAARDATGKAAAGRTTATAKAEVDAIKKSPSNTWPISSLTKVRVSGHADNIYNVDGEKVLCNGTSHFAVTVSIVGSTVTRVGDFGACDSTKIYKK